MVLETRCRWTYLGNQTAGVRVDFDTQGVDASPCIIDLRAFSREACGKDQLIEKTDFLTSRQNVDLPPGPTTVGVIALGISRGRIDAMPADEFIIVLEGSLQVEGSAEFTLKAGESAVLPKNSVIDWTADRPSIIGFMRQESDSASRLDPVKIDPTRPRQPSPPLPDGVVIGEMPRAFRHLDFQSDDGLFTAGGWNADGYARRPMTYDFFELMHLQDGSITLTDRKGVDHVFGKNDVLVIRKGGVAAWVSKVPVSKVAALCRA